MKRECRPYLQVLVGVVLGGRGEGCYAQPRALWVHALLRQKLHVGRRSPGRGDRVVVWCGVGVGGSKAASMARPRLSEALHL